MICCKVETYVYCFVKHNIFVIHNISEVHSAVALSFLTYYFDIFI